MANHVLALCGFNVVGHDMVELCQPETLSIILNLVANKDSAWRANE